MLLYFILAILLSVADVSHCAIKFVIKHLVLSCNTCISRLVPSWNSICLEDEMYARHRLFKYCSLFKWFKMFTDAMFGTDTTADQRAAR